MRRFKSKRFDSQLRVDQQSSTRRTRRGMLSMELVLVLPLLMALLLGLLQFSLLFLARGNVVEASRTGARTASYSGVQQQMVEQEVRKVLPPRFQDQMEVLVQAGQRSGDVVAVLVRVPMSAATPDLLWPIGFSVNGRYLEAETRMVKE